MKEVETVCTEGSLHEMSVSNYKAFMKTFYFNKFWPINFDTTHTCSLFLRQLDLLFLRISDFGV